MFWLAVAGRDMYRMLHENIQQMRGSFKHTPLSAEVRRRQTLLAKAACTWLTSFDCCLRLASMSAA